jgi:hypothetical protein
LKNQILELLACELVLEAWDKKLLTASKLIHVPERFTDNAGIPLTLTPAKEGVYISQGYAHDDYEHLKVLGVIEMCEAKFLDHLEEITRYRLEFFTNKPAAWHSRLAAVLRQIWEAPQTQIRRKRYYGADGASDQGSHRSHRRRKKGRSSISDFTEDGALATEEQPVDKLQDRIKKLPVIPLRDGKWVCGDGNKVFFSGEMYQYEIPGGIDVTPVSVDSNILCRMNSWICE